MDREKIISEFERWCDEMDDECPVICLDALALLKEQDDMGKELTDAMELIHKKNARIIELLDMLKEQEAVVPIPLSNRRYACGSCGNSLWVSGQRFCASCGKAVKWE